MSSEHSDAEYEAFFDEILRAKKPGPAIHRMTTEQRVRYFVWLESKTEAYRDELRRDLYKFAFVDIPREAPTPHECVRQLKVVSIKREMRNIQDLLGDTDAEENKTLLPGAVTVLLAQKQALALKLRALELDP